VSWRVLSPLAPLGKGGTGWFESLLRLGDYLTEKLVILFSLIPRPLLPEREKGIQSPSPSLGEGLRVRVKGCKRPTF
jgi:hypothetical protein